jgi:hypothetical protein
VVKAYPTPRRRLRAPLHLDVTIRQKESYPRFNTRKEKIMKYNGLGIQKSAYGTTSMFFGLDDEFLDPSRGRGQLENIIDLS